MIIPPWKISKHLDICQPNPANIIHFLWMWNRNDCLVGSHYLAIHGGFWVHFMWEASWTTRGTMTIWFVLVNFQALIAHGQVLFLKTALDVLTRLDFTRIQKESHLLDPNCGGSTSHNRKKTRILTQKKLVLHYHRIGVPYKDWGGVQSDIRI